MTTDNPAPLPEGMETTFEDREHIRRGDWTHVPPDVAQSLLRDHDRALAESARLKTAVLEWGDAAHRQAAEVARLTEENALLGRKLVVMQGEQDKLAAERAALPEGMETTAEAEERLCDCGAGHGSLEGHTDWCSWQPVARLLDRALAEIARLAAALAEAEKRVDNLSAALSSTRSQVSEQSDRADTADELRVAVETGKVHRAFAIDLNEHRDAAYKNGWNDGYAEGEGKAVAQIPDLVRRMGDDATAREQRAREEEREAIALEGERLQSDRDSEAVCAYVDRIRARSTT